MEQLTLNLPTLYGDHHVLRVRRLVLALPGVAEVQASAARQELVVAFDPARLSLDSLESILEENGYPPGGPLPGVIGYLDDLRHVAAMEHAAPASEHKYSTPSPLGACPGLEHRVIEGEHPADR